MIRRLLLFSAMALMSLQVNAADRNWLSDSREKAVVALTADNVGKWRAESRSAALLGIAELPEKAKKHIIAEAEKSLSFGWPALKREEFEMFEQSGNRSVFEASLFERRKALQSLVMGELAERKGRFIPQIIKGIHASMQENTWVLPAHLGKSWTEDKAEVVDIFSAQTGCDLAWTALLLGEDLDKAEKGLSAALKKEIKVRVLEPALKNKYWWNKGTNNWNIWICCNWFQALLICDDDAGFRRESIAKLFKVADVFLNAYPEDGGCDEGPGYWSVAGGKLVRFAAVLKDSTGGSIDLFTKPLIREIARYIMYAHIDRKYFTNFSDCSATAGPDAVLAFAAGAYLNDEQMKDFAGYMRDQNSHPFAKIISADLAWYHRFGPEIGKRDPRAPFFKNTWLQDLQVMTARTEKGSSRGLYLAVRGGHNDESHNHNDVGHFIVYADGIPAIIDVGVGTYSKKTFSKERYDLWYMSSDWHNLPAINGHVQSAGARYAARGVSVEMKDGNEVMKLDIARAYPSKAQVKSWVRTAGLYDGKTVRIEDRYELSKALKPAEWSFITPLAVEIDNEKGIVQLKAESGGKALLVLKYDGRRCSAKAEDKEHDDKKIEQMWGRIRRIVITGKEMSVSGKYTFEMAMP